MSTSNESENVYPTSEDGYDVYEEIGTGAFATVYRGIVKETKEEVAIKVLDLDQFNTNWDEIRQEIAIMRSLHHANIVDIVASFVQDQNLWIVMPILAGGSCASIMRKLFPNGFKDEALIATILRETLKGLVYFHKDGRIHRDVKAGNILVSDRGEIKLADFGVAGTLMENGDRQKSRQTFTGTPCWMAPEVMEQTNGYDTKADIWSFGITAMELGYGRAPYSKHHPMKVLLLTLESEPPTCDVYEDFSYTFSDAFHSLIAKCLKKDAKQRPSAGKLLEHRFFKKAKDCKYVMERLVSLLDLNNRSTKQAPRMCSSITAHVGDKREEHKPVTVGQWSFDFDEEGSEQQQEQEQQAAQTNLYSPSAATRSSMPDFGSLGTEQESSQSTSTHSENA